MSRSADMLVLIERTEVLDDTHVAKLRKDFLTLMRNIKRLRSYDDAAKVKKALRFWHDRLEGHMVQLREELKGRVRESKRDPMAPGSESMLRVNQSWAEHYLKNMRPVWDFMFEVRNFPMTSFEYQKATRYGGRPRRRTGVGEYHAMGDAEWKASIFEGRKEDIRKWAQRTKRKAPPAWKYLKEVGEWMGAEGYYGGGGERAKLKTFEKTNVRLSGFQVQIVGYNSGDEWHRKNLVKFKKALVIYRKRAAKVYPWLLRYKLPFVLNFESDRCDIDTAATYGRDHIDIATCGLSAAPSRQAHVLAHEMGHHIWQTALGEGARDVWRSFIRRNYTDIDFNDILAQMKPGESIDDLQKRVEKTMPLLHLQLDTLIHAPDYKHLNLWSFEKIKKYLDNNGNPKLRVPAIPITGYAAKNPEEAFCETLGLLVGYGPRTLNIRVVKLMQSLVGNVKLESVQSLTRELRECDMPVRWNV